MSPCAGDDCIAPAADAAEALARMRRSGKTRLYVVSDGCLVGILSLRDLLEVLALKIEMETDGDQPKQMRTDERQG